MLNSFFFFIYSHRNQVRICFVAHADVIANCVWTHVARTAT